MFRALSARAPPIETRAFYPLKALGLDPSGWAMAHKLASWDSLLHALETHSHAHPVGRHSPWQAEAWPESPPRHSIGLRAEQDTDTPSMAQEGHTPFLV